MRRPLALLAATALLAAVPATAAPAHALDCVGPTWVDDRDADIPHVLVGRIVDSRDRRLLVEVSEIWRGPRLPEQVWVQLDRDVFWYAFSNRAGEVPDGYSSPQTWVMAATAELKVGVCSYWTPSRSVRQALEPDRPTRPLPSATGSGTDAEPSSIVDPVRGAAPDDPSPLPVVGGALVAGLAAAGSWWWRRRRAGGA